MEFICPRWQSARPSSREPDHYLPSSFFGSTLALVPPPGMSGHQDEAEAEPVVCHFAIVSVHVLHVTGRLHGVELLPIARFRFLRAGKILSVLDFAQRGNQRRMIGRFFVQDAESRGACPDIKAYGLRRWDPVKKSENLLAGMSQIGEVAELVGSSRRMVELPGSEAVEGCARPIGVGTVGIEDRQVSVTAARDPVGAAGTAPILVKERRLTFLPLS